jgi:tRNA(fMet)-specific endonuclease VapC
MTPCLDTTVFVDLGGRSGARLKAAAQKIVVDLSIQEGAPVTTRINVAELYVGIELSNDPPAEAAAVRAALVDTQILEFDNAAAQKFGVIRAHLQRRGLLVGDMDILIAAIALTNGHSIVTRNPNHFRNIPGLTIITYGTP